MIIALCKKHKLKALYHFSSTTDNKYFNKKSDIDFLHEFGFENYQDWDKEDFDIVTNF